MNGARIAWGSGPVHWLVTGSLRATHTNTIAGFWSILKRGIVGTFHEVTIKYFALYVAEFRFRYNNRQNEDICGMAIKGC